MATKNKPAKDFQLIKAIRDERHYKWTVKRRDHSVRKYVKENLEIGDHKKIMPGQLIMFNYFEPKTKEELEYYDAMPCTIFFGVRKLEDGNLRVIGFNIHYYPPRIRYILLDRIFDIFKPIYLKNWDHALETEISYFNYKMLIDQLKKAKLDFGIRMYDPKLMAKITPIPPDTWSKAVFTEGHFKKRTREAIIKYWKNKKINYD